MILPTIVLRTFFILISGSIITLTLTLTLSKKHVNFVLVACWWLGDWLAYVIVSSLRQCDRDPWPIHSGKGVPWYFAMVRVAYIRFNTCKVPFVMAQGCHFTKIIGGNITLCHRHRLSLCVMLVFKNIKFLTLIYLICMSWQLNK